MEWYLSHRRTLEAEVKKYSDPASEALLPPHPAHMRCVPSIRLTLCLLRLEPDFTASTMVLALSYPIHSFTTHQEL